jgi:hypothetical protein
MIKSIYKFKSFSYDINKILTPTDISLAINKFYVDELKASKNKFAILFKVKTSDGD